MDTKAANRIAWARDEGIYRKTNVAQLECLVCGRRLSSAVLPRSSHAKRHVREGKAVPRTEYGHDGPRTVYDPSPSMLAEWRRSPFVSGRSASRFGHD